MCVVAFDVSMKFAEIPYRTDDTLRSGGWVGPPQDAVLARTTLCQRFSSRPLDLRGVKSGAVSASRTPSRDRATGARLKNRIHSVLATHLILELRLPICSERRDVRGTLTSRCPCKSAWPSRSAGEKSIDLAKISRLWIEIAAAAPARKLARTIRYIVILY
jgi:hypothetical protein